MHGDLQKNALRPGMILLAVLVLACACIPASAGSWHRLGKFFSLNDFSDAADDMPFSLHVLEVGKADSLLLECGGEAMLVDGGTADRGEEVIRYLRRRGWDSLRYVVNTHPDADHIGGLAEVLKDFSVGTYLCPRLPDSLLPDTEEFRAVKNALAQKEMEPVYAADGQSFSLGKASVTIYQPEVEAKSLNNASLILYVAYKNTFFLLMGDAELEEEEALLAQNRTLKADVLKVGHHGSETSTGKALLNAVTPRFAAISVANDRNNLPRVKVLRRLQAAGTEVCRTDVSGTLLFLSDGKEVRLLTER
ncbi:ComEC/Rec2 family competence protein [Anaeromassilibacillus senegalensis]|uniref:ComEC/Rec2 family competence protein n=1 Tax=Anaeromassilibacillus senegalensis TaxID=1673717 RepID=UPI00067FF984|nr:MBL fold metallo-hydrolase [Anaeromassilibacillus senegalensis]